MSSQAPPGHRDLRISVALPVHNEMHTLRDVVTSTVEVLNDCTVRDWEIVMVDDGSTDDSRRVMAEMTRAYPNARAFSHGSRRGFAAVQRSCYAHSRLDWVFLLPADGQVSPGVLKDLIPYCDAFDIVCGTVACPPERLGRRIVSSIYHRVVETIFALKIGKFGSCLLVRREIINKVSVRAETPVAMTELLVRARGAGARIVGIEIEKLPRKFGEGLGGSVATSSLHILRDLGALWWQLRYAGDR